MDGCWQYVDELLALDDEGWTEEEVEAEAEIEFVTDEEIELFERARWRDRQFLLAIDARRHAKRPPVHLRRPIRRVPQPRGRRIRTPRRARAPNRRRADDPHPQVVRGPAGAGRLGVEAA
jgi:hypothetical protein